MKSNRIPEAHRNSAVFAAICANRCFKRPASGGKRNRRFLKDM